MKLTLQTQLLPDAEAGESSGDTILNFSELGMVSLRQVSFGKEEET
jgi:hypothetical protein